MRNVLRPPSSATRGQVSPSKNWYPNPVPSPPLPPPHLSSGITSASTAVLSAFSSFFFAAPPDAAPPARSIMANTCAMQQMTQMRSEGVDDADGEAR